MTNYPDQNPRAVDSRGFLGTSKTKPDNVRTTGSGQLSDFTVDKPLPALPKKSQPTANIFSKNVAKPTLHTELPKKQDRIDKTPQLAYCARLLLSDEGAMLGEPQREWLKEMEQDSAGMDRIHWLVTRMVDEFVKDLTKDPVEIAEIVLLGPVLGREHYRKLLSYIITEFDNSVLLDVGLLQGLVQLIQTASPGFHMSDDLIKILSILGTRLQSTHQQSTEHSYHLTLAVSRVLDIMAENEVQDLDRVQEHEPLAEVLSGLEGSSDPYLQYQACYAFQALQYVPDEETALQAVLRHSTGVVDNVVKISGVFKLDLSSILEGLGNLQEALSSAIEVASSTYEGVCSLMESGQGVLASLKEGFESSKKRSWYAAVRAAYAFAQAGQLADLNRFICHAPCRRDPLFQWGICQLLGEIAADPVWTVESRQQAIDLLEELYRNDPEWGQDESVKTWMVTIISCLSSTPEKNVGTRDTREQLLFHEIKRDQDAPIHLYQLRSRLPIPSSSPLLFRVLEIPDLEYDLSRIRLQRLDDIQQAVFIPPQAKQSLQARDEDLFPLMENVQDFLVSSRQVMLILGDSGAGKSTFNRHLEHQLWTKYKQGGSIPLFINLPTIDQPNQDMIGKHLHTNNFSDDQIMEMKLQRHFILICDGYDESQQLVNLHRTNKLNQPGQWNTKMVISCRSQYLGQDYRSRFIPQNSDRYARQRLDLFQEAVIAPFSKDQIKSYLDQYVPLEPRTWATDDYMDKLTTIPNLLDLVKNPFLLTLALEALPDAIAGKQDLLTIKLTRVQLYDIFVVHWLEVNKRRLESNTLSVDERETLDLLLDAGFTLMGVNYSTRLAESIFEKQDGNPVVQYTHLRDKYTWKAEFFSPDPEVRLLRESSPLMRTGNYFRFVHRSMLEYFFSRVVYSPVEEENECDPSVTNNEPLDPDGPLFKKNLLTEPSIIQFLCDRVQQSVGFKQQLLDIVELSKTDASVSIAGANAMSILVKSGVSFNSINLQGIRIPGADVSEGQFDSAQLQGADLRGANLGRVWLREANLSSAQLGEIRFGELPYLKERCPISSCVYSFDGRMLVLGLQDQAIAIYDTTTWTRLHELKGHRKNIFSVVVSPDSRQIVSVGFDQTVRVWDMASSECLKVMMGHTRAVTTVAFAPCGKQVASAGDDATVRVWDLESGESVFVLKGHKGRITSIAYSPDGLRLVSGGMDGTIRSWDPATGDSSAVWQAGRVYSLAYTREGKRIASGHVSGDIQFWNVDFGERDLVVRGHTNTVTSIVFSASGQWMSSCSQDNSVRLWDVSAGTLISVFSGHKGVANGVAFSPNDRQLASVGVDHSLRLWDVDTSRSSFGIQSHSRSVYSIAYTSDGRFIHSGSHDHSVRRWDALTGSPASILFKGTETPKSMGYSPDGHQIASGSEKNVIQLWDRHTGLLEREFRGDIGPIKSLTYSPCSQWLLSGTGMTVRLWDLQDPELFPTHTFTEDHAIYVTWVAFSPGGHQFAAGKTNGAVRLYDFATKTVSKTINLSSGHTSLTLVYSPTGHQLAIGTSSRAILLWDLESDEPSVKLEGHSAPIACIAYSPCEQWITSGAEDDTIRLWKKQTFEGGKEENWSFMYSVQGFFRTVECVVWNPVVPMEFASGCSDSSVRVWRVSMDKVPVEDPVVVTMVWGSNIGRLCVQDLLSKDVVGLSATNRRLLVQRGADDYSLPDEGEELDESVRGSL